MLRLRQLTNKHILPVVIIVILIIFSTFILYLISSNHTKTNIADNNKTKDGSTDLSKSSDVTTYSPGSINGLLTNEFAFYNPGDSTSIKSSDWDVTSGSLFAKDGSFWSGIPDSCDSPSAFSSNCTNSNVFRANTKKRFSGDVSVSISLKQLSDIHNKNCNENDTCWQGVHLWMRYQNQFNLYYASINRADGEVVIKRKVPCGSDNSGTYFVLGSYVNYDFKNYEWNNYIVSIHTNDDQSVTITIADAQNKPIAVGTDKGGINSSWSSSCTTLGKYPTNRYNPITLSGNVGVRGDYSDFVFKDFSVNSKP